MPLGTRSLRYQTHMRFPKALVLPSYRYTDMLSSRFWLYVVAGLLLVEGTTAASTAASPRLVPVAGADTTTYPHPPDDDDPECAQNLVGCVVGAALYAVLGPPLRFLLSDARVAGTGGPASALSLRAGRTVRYSPGTGVALYPYVALGMRSQQVRPVSVQTRTEEIFLEAAAGVRSPLHTWTPGGADWLRRVHLATEARWLHRSSTHDQLWMEVAPGLATARPASPSRLVLAPTLAVGVAGPERGTVQPGLSLGVHW